MFICVSHVQIYVCIQGWTVRQLWQRDSRLYFYVSRTSDTRESVRPCPRKLCEIVGGAWGVWGVQHFAMSSSVLIQPLQELGLHSWRVSGSWTEFVNLFYYSTNMSNRSSSLCYISSGETSSGSQCQASKPLNVFVPVSKHAFNAV